MKQGVFARKRVTVIADDPEQIRWLQSVLLQHGGTVQIARTLEEAMVQMMTFKPDLAIVDERMGQTFPNLLATVKRLRHSVRILLLTRQQVPQRSIDVTARGITYSVPLNCSDDILYQALKHCLSITSVPRVERTGTD